MILKRGDKGPKIIELQKLLNVKGFFNSDYAENFGPKTESAVKAYQASINMEPDGVVTDDLWKKLNEPSNAGSKTLTIEVLKNTFKKFGYTWYSDRPNIIGIRTTLDVPEAFNDIMCIVYPEGGTEVMKTYTTTTNPGTYWLQNPMNKLGAAVLKPGQYINSHAVGYHQNKQEHKALVQVGKVTVYRDNDKDKYSEEQGIEDSGLHGINIHGANKNMKTMAIGKWSAGCTVFQVWSHKEEFIAICEKFKKITSNKFTYTLLRESELTI